MHALIIEDESLIAAEIEWVLLQSGFDSIAFAASERAAITEAAAQCPDLITCDVRLNPGSGLEAIESICSAKRISVIFVTGSKAEAEVRYPDHPILEKPFSYGDLRKEVALALLRRH